MLGYKQSLPRYKRHLTISGRYLATNGLSLACCKKQYLARSSTSLQAVPCKKQYLAASGTLQEAVPRCKRYLARSSTLQEAVPRYLATSGISAPLLMLMQSTSVSVMSTECSNSANVTGSAYDQKGITSTTDTQHSVGMLSNTRGPGMLTKWSNSKDIGGSAYSKGSTSTTNMDPNIDRPRGSHPITSSSAYQGFILGDHDAPEDGTMRNNMLDTRWSCLYPPDEMEEEEVDQLNPLSPSTPRLPCFGTETSPADVILSTLVLIEESSEDGGFTPCLTSDIRVDPTLASDDADSRLMNSYLPSESLPNYHSSNLSPTRKLVPKFRERTRPAQAKLSLIELGPNIDEMDFNPCNDYSSFPSPIKGTWYKIMLRSKSAALFARQTLGHSGRASPAQERRVTTAPLKGPMPTVEETPIRESGCKPDNAEEAARLEVYEASVKQEVHKDAVKPESCAGLAQPTRHKPASLEKQPSSVQTSTRVGDPSSSGHQPVKQASQRVLLSLPQKPSVRKQASQRVLLSLPQKPSVRKQASRRVLLSLPQKPSVRKQASELYLRGGGQLSLGQKPPLTRHTSQVQLSMERVQTSLGQNQPPRKQSSMSQISMRGQSGESKIEGLSDGVKGAVDIMEGMKQEAPRRRCRGHWIGVYRRYQKHMTLDGSVSVLAEACN
eukprot:gene26019-11718_t